MPAWSIPILKNLVYPLAIKLAGWIYNRFIAEISKDEMEKKALAIKVLNEKIKKAETDEELQGLSIALDALNSGK